MLLNFTKRIVKRIKSKNDNCRKSFHSSNSTNNNGNGRILTNPNVVQLPHLSIPEYVLSKIEKFSNFTAYECSETKRKYTFRDIEWKSRNLSKALRKKLGLKKNDTILLFLPNVPEFTIALIGCLWAGITVSPINPIYTPDEIERQITDSSSKLIITSYELYDKAKKANEKLPKKLPIICLKTKHDQLLPQDTINWDELANSNIDIPDLEFPSSDTLALLQYSSGTTGLPKGVELTHFNVASNFVQCFSIYEASVQTATKEFQEVSPLVIPMFHVYGLSVALNLMTTGTKLVTLPKFTPDSFVNLLDDHNITLLNAAPPLIIFMTNYEDIKPKHVKNIHFTFSGAAPLGSSDEENYLRKIGSDSVIIQGYGLTESSPTVTILPETLKRQYKSKLQSSVGIPVPNTQLKLVKIDDQSGTPVGPNEPGEFLIKGPQVMRGYRNNPEATANTFLDGWLKTGDLGYYDDEHGCLFITDRIKELIKVRGFQVPPAELEEILRSHPNVEEAAVIGIPDAVSGEIPRAYIKPTGQANIDDIQTFINEKVAKYKRLDGGIEIIDEIPKSPSGKILRKELKLYYEKNST